MLLDSKGLKIGAFDPLTAAILGNTPGELGSNILAEAQTHPRSSVLLRDWLYCLVKATSTMLHKRFISRPGRSAEEFIETIEGNYSLGGEEFEILAPPLTSERVEESVISALARAEELAREYSLDRITDPALTLGLLENSDKELQEYLAAWLGGEEQYKAFLAKVKRALIPHETDDEPYEKDGRLRVRLFRGNGRKLLDRLIEDAASMGARKISTRHLLYTLLGDEGTLLARSLTIMGMDVKRDLHATLSRELCRPGVKRTENLELSKAFLLETVIKVFELAKKYANERDGRGILEHDISLAFIQRQQRELKRLFAGKRSADLNVLKDMMEDTEPVVGDEEESQLLRLSIADIERRIKERIHGQDNAIDRIMPWIKRLRFGIPRDERPAGVFLFLGPTGTGKTQLAKELARYVFGNEDMMIYLEMGQFKTKESMNMFIGAPPGYVGYGDGKLTNGLRDNPESVVLFDEIEKADSQVFDAVLRFADEGIISDPAGPVRNGRKCLIVMTTNAGQSWLRTEMQHNPSIIEEPDALAERLFEAAMAELAKRDFKPEFLGRVDERITFLPLSEKTCRSIIDLVLERELAKFKDLKNVEITVDESARELLGRFAHRRSMEEGARGAPRAVNEYIVTPVIDKLNDLAAEGDIADGVRINATAVGLTAIALEVRK